jgi:hypothetical protein
MYGASGEAPKAEPKPISRAAAGERMYRKGSDTGFSHDWALGNYFGRRDASLRDDPERLQESRSERRQLHELSEKYNVSPAVLHDGLVALREHEQNPRKAATTEERFRATFEEFRLEANTEGATELWTRAQKGATILDKACPTIAARANTTGVAADPRAMRFLAALADEPTPPLPAAQE